MDVAPPSPSKTMKVLQADALVKQYERTVLEFVQQQSGHFVAVTDDPTFSSLLRSLLHKQLALAESCVTTVLDESRIVKDIQNALKNKQRVLVFIERVLGHKDISFLIKQIKTAFESAKIVVLSNEADVQSVAFLHEIGADNFIAKPISLNNLVEKVASTLKPQSKIGEIIEKGKALLAKGTYEAALKLAEKLLQIKPGSAAALMIKGDALYALNQKQMAVDAFLAASDNAPLYMEPLNKLVNFYRQEGDTARELEYLQALDKLSPLNVERKVEIGGAHLGLGNKQEAETVFDKALKQARKQASIRIKDVSQRIGDIYVRRDPVKAEAYYRKALDSVAGAHTEDEILIYNQLGMTLRKQGRWKEAVEEYRKALKIAPKDENLHYNMAMAMSEGKRYSEAVKMLEKALALNPRLHEKSPVISHNMGVVFHKQGNAATAKTFFEHALALDSSFESSRKMLASLE